MASPSTTTMDNVLGLLRVRVVRGVNLAVRDLRSSDPYVVLKMGKQKLKTRVVKKNVNPEWNEDLTFSITEPILPVRLEVFDHDTFTPDDPMGDAEFDIQPFMEAVKLQLECTPSGTIVKRLEPNRKNCLAEESHIVWLDGKVVQDICLRLSHVECGEVQLQLQWISLPGRSF
ncbi:protein C2-DOMAIN ABA-RELATED 4-like isoform X1 [Magnolia sinica]|uniref:protein C2-DOMAIN ABA-RELATED 4-like isoform X1 n=1 Tax=Magnolia sinica TaxID=86752 RepID=UPI0026585862|nr:protein C2-DOMAIN ABA-RELATED 4-like isoform X1 [Magnolia sinica]